MKFLLLSVCPINGCMIMKSKRKVKKYYVLKLRQRADTSNGACLMKPTLSSIVSTDVLPLQHRVALPCHFLVL